MTDKSEKIWHWYLISYSFAYGADNFRANSITMTNQKNCFDYPILKSIKEQICKENGKSIKEEDIVIENIMYLCQDTELGFLGKGNE